MFSTEVLPFPQENPPSSSLEAGAFWLQKGEVIGFPTETVYGLGALEKGRDKLFSLKRRSLEKPFTWHISHPDVVFQFLPSIPSLAKRIMKQYWPGPVTVVVPHPEKGTLGFRQPAHEGLQHLIEKVGGAILGTSANLSGEPPATTAEEVFRLYQGKIPLILDAGAAPLKEASTVVYVDDKGWKILREGIISASMIEKLAQGKFLFVCTGNTCRSPLAAQLFRHSLSKFLQIPEEKLEKEGFFVKSAGLFAPSNLPATDHARQVAKEWGVSLDWHSSQPLTKELVDWADYIFVMTQSHYDSLLASYPEAKHKVFLLHPEGIPDPFGGSVETYRQTARRIQEGLEKILLEIYPSYGKKG